MLEMRGFYVFDVDSQADEAYVLEVLTEMGLENVQVVEREWDMERVYITYDHTKPLPRNFSEIVAERGVIC